MNKWYEESAKGNDVIVSSKLRLARNLKNYCFSSKLTTDDSTKLVTEITSGLKELITEGGEPMHYNRLEDLSEIERMALKERKILNASAIQKKMPMALMISEDESSSLVINGDDHIRIQMLGSGNCLSGLLKQADRIDDYIDNRFAYAFDRKYGYLTSYPTNVGTGMRASLTLHLPGLASGTKFRNLAGDMGRFGITVKGVFGEGPENYGCLYEVSNQKTLGQSEQAIVDVVERVAGQLARQEKKIRSMVMENYRMVQVDEVYKSIGVLKYARRLSLKETMIYLSHLRFGIAEGFLKVPENFSTDRIMMGILPANLQNMADKPYSKEELEIARAEFVRAALPDIN